MGSFLKGGLIRSGTGLLRNKGGSAHSKLLAASGLKSGGIGKGQAEVSQINPI